MAQIFVINGIQTQSGHRYSGQWFAQYERFGRCGALKPRPEGTLQWLQAFRANLDGLAPQALAPTDANGYWRKLAGMVLEVE